MSLWGIMTEKAMALATEYKSYLVQALGPHLKQVILFGSQARGNATEGSDYDVLVVVDERTPEIREMILDADVAMMDRHEVLFAALHYSEQEWRQMQGFPLAWNIRQDGVAL